MSSYEVGQVVYLLKHETLKIMPAIVTEEITRKTVGGVSIQYILELPDKGTVNSDKVVESIFKDVDTLRAHMLENTKKSVEKLIENALVVENKAFGKKEEIVEKHVQNDIKDVILKENNKNIQTQEE